MSSKAQMDIFIFFRATAAAATAAWLVLEAEKPFVGYMAHICLAYMVFGFLLPTMAPSIYNTHSNSYLLTTQTVKHAKLLRESTHAIRELLM